MENDGLIRNAIFTLQMFNELLLLVVIRQIIKFVWYGHCWKTKLKEFEKKF